MRTCGLMQKNDEMGAHDISYSQDGARKKTLRLQINTNIEAYILVLRSYKFMKDTKWNTINILRV